MGHHRASPFSLSFLFGLLALAATAACGTLTGVDDYEVGDDEPSGDGGSADTGSGTGTGTGTGTSGEVEDPALTAVCTSKTNFDLCYECCEATYPESNLGLVDMAYIHCGCRPASPCLSECGTDPLCVTGERSISEACSSCFSEAASNTECLSGAILECEQVPSCSAMVHCAQSCPN